MKILYLMTEPFGIGGVQSDLLILSEGLARRGHEVAVATTDGELLDELTARGAVFVDIDFRFRHPLRLLRAMLALRRAVAAQAPDVVAPQSVRSAIVAFLALRPIGLRRRGPSPRARLPIVTTIHNIHNPRNFKWAGRILRLCSDFVIFESNYERDRLLAAGLDARRSRVIHSGIDIARLGRPGDIGVLARNYGLDPDRHLIYGIVARLSEEKGHRYLIEAFARVAARKEHARLLVIGDGPLLDAVRQQVQALGLSRRVVLAGTQRDIATHLALLHVFVLASTRESFPLSAREAMAAATPVVAPRIGGCPEVVEDRVTGLLFESANIDDLADKLLQLADPALQRAMGDAGRERALRLFSHDAWVAGDEQVYLEFAGRVTGPAGAAA